MFRSQSFSIAKKKKVVSNFISSKIRPLLCSQALHEQTVSQPTVQLDGRMDNVRSTQKMILNRTVYININNILSAFSGVGYKKYQK